MSDIIYETIRVVILLQVVFYLVKAGMNRSELCRKGWSFVLAGFGMLLFASIMDVTDNFESLNRFLVIGDTPMEAFFEKIVGCLGGFLLLAVGLARWIPTITGVEHTRQLNKALEAEIAERKLTERRLADSVAKLKRSMDITEEVNRRLELETARASGMA